MFKKIVIFVIKIFLIQSSRISDALDGYDPTNLRFDCDNGNYISTFLVCDGVDDCKDGTDEDSCRKLCLNDPSGDECINEICSLNSTLVESRGEITICTNHSDEKKCTPTTYGVVGAFYCNAGDKCIPLNETCYSSERNCKENGGKFQCQKKILQINDTLGPTIESDEDYSYVALIIGIFLGICVTAFQLYRDSFISYCFYYSYSSASGLARLKNILNMSEPNDCSYEWVDREVGTLAGYAVSAGRINGFEVYVIRVCYRNEIIPGILWQERVFIPYKNRTVKIKAGDYEVLTNPKETLKWIPWSSSRSFEDLPGKLVVGGGYQHKESKNSDKETYYIGKKQCRRLTFGKVKASDKRCYRMNSYCKKHLSQRLCKCDPYEILVDASA